MSVEWERFRPYTIEEGRFLVKLARRAVEERLLSGRKLGVPSDAPQRLLEDAYGVFTTIETYRGGRRELRGCIGFPRGYRNVAAAVVEAALAAAFEDPRFPPLSKSELSEIVFEVSVLSPLEEVRVRSPREYPRAIKVGIHGLMIEAGIFGGLLLPQVPVEYGWDEEEFLCETCMKAGLTPDCWLEEGTRVYRFQAQIFAELTPGGEVVERDLLKELEERRAGEAAS